MNLYSQWYRFWYSQLDFYTRKLNNWTANCYRATLTPFTTRGFGSQCHPVPEANEAIQ